MPALPTRVGVGVCSVQPAHAADYVKQVDGSPGKGHPELSEARTRLFGLSPQLLQLLLVLTVTQAEGEISEEKKGFESEREGLAGHSMVEML